MQTQKTQASFILGLFIAAGLIGLGYLISAAIIKVKGYERVVMVKGLAEKYVKANTAIFPIRFESSNNDLTILNKKIKSDINTVEHFLSELGFDKNEISVSAPEITDKFAQGYSDNNIKIRYVSSTIISIYTKQVEKVIKLHKELFKLNEKGILAKNNSYDTHYLFTGLNKIKPEMIQEATKNARAAAMKFAKDSNSALGKIKNANQGYFSISNRDSSTPYIKKVRVVTNITYYLDD